ncbi:zinc-binding dehydrogenase [Neorhizobium sp. T25_13]|uniref:zinc-dependent alcohol dehydrogenase n=1 Tax=Neorhizobium sp. T25_13 TaxID=2093830 RepID=UPI000CF87006|nr:alcohol dehydrogenase catalytic domain-containing protein [Neorhizobium sp. T25_13]
MLALQKVRPAVGLEFRAVDAPLEAPPGEAIVRVHSAGICGTDLHIADWTPGYESMAGAMPVTLGHEFSGTIAKVGAGLSDTLVGRRVTARPSTTCGTCAACLAGDEDNCSNRKGVGIGRNGAFAQFVCVPYSNCHALPDRLDMGIAALTEPMTVCAEAVKTAEVQAGQRILVIGPGFIGQGIAVLARAKGAKVVVIGRNDGPRLGALRAIGFEHLVDTAEIPLEEALAGYPPFDAIIEAAGVPALVSATLPYLKKRGIFTVVGIHSKPAEIDLVRLVRLHQQIRGSYRAAAHDWDGVIAFLAENQETISKLVSQRLPLAEAMTGFTAAHDRTASKVVLTIGGDA